MLVIHRVDISVTVFRETGESSYQAEVTAAAARRLTFGGSRLVSVPPCLRPIEEEEETMDCDAASTASSSSSSCDEMSFSDDELSGLNDDNDYLDAQAVTLPHRFDDVSFTDVSSHNRKYISQHNNNVVQISIIIYNFRQLC